MPDQAKGRGGKSSAPLLPFPVTSLVMSGLSIKLKENLTTKVSAAFSFYPNATTSLPTTPPSHAAFPAEQLQIRVFHGCPPSPDAWGRLNVVTPFHHLSGDSHLHRSLGAGPITASKPGSTCSCSH